MTKIPVDIISGFLGSGKTTLLNELLKNQYKNMRLAVIENEFGEVDVDSGLFPDGLEITKITGGCVCCTLKTSLIEGIQVLKERFCPDRIAIETTGIAGLSDVVLAVDSESLNDMAYTAMKITVINPVFHNSIGSSLGSFYTDQVKTADTVYITRAQSTDKSITDKAINSIRVLNESCNIVFDPAGIIIPASDTYLHEHITHSAHHHRHEDTSKKFSSTYIETSSFQSREELKELIRKVTADFYPKTVYRIKGTVTAAGQSVLVQWAGGELKFSDAKSSENKLVIVTEA